MAAVAQQTHYEEQGEQQGDMEEVSYVYSAAGVSCAWQRPRRPVGEDDISIDIDVRRSGVQGGCIVLMYCCMVLSIVFSPCIWVAL